MMRFVILMVVLLSSIQLEAQPLFKAAKADFENKKYEDGLKKINEVIAQNGENAEYLKLQADFYAFLYQTEKSATAYFKAITLERSKAQPDHDFLGETYYYLSGCYYQIGQFQTSIRHCKNGLSYQPSDQIKSNLRYNLSSSFARLGNYDSAMFYLNTSYTYDLKMGDSAAISTDLNSLAYIQAQKGAYEKALKLYEESAAYLETLKNGKSRLMANRLSNIGMMQYHLGRFKEAEHNLLNSQKTYEMMSDSIKIITQIVNLSKVYKATGRISAAKRNLMIANLYLKDGYLMGYSSYKAAAWGTLFGVRFKKSGTQRS